MRFFILVFLSMACSIGWAAPITYIFEGHTTGILSNVGDLDPRSALIRDDGLVITNGNAFMSGQIVFDPMATRSGAGGTGRGEVLSWAFSTLGLTYHNAGGAFHYLNFLSNSFVYADEVPLGGYGPDVVSMDLDFSGSPFAFGPDHFPIEDFIGGRFSTAIDLAWVNDSITMYGLTGVITSMRASVVPGPSSVVTLLTGLLFVWVRRPSKKVLPS
ncbi:hypothetical protein [Marinobacter apostichopi]|uniref:hypothetical protein n=1 Tax=Marinobacter apostichopi TaxID=3035454 RepID=UPI002572D998|nr:hypothetical protein [Marinobacter sp. LA51]